MSAQIDNEKVTGNTVERVANVELHNCILIKMVLMLLIVVGHSTIFWTGDWFTCNPVIPSGGLGGLSKWLNSFHTYTFVLVSGYIFAKKMIGGGYPQYIPFLIKKVKRLLIPYAFTALVWVIPITQLFFHYDGYDLMKKYVLCSSPSQLWFLWMLFWIFVIAYGMWKLLSGSKVWGITSALICYVVGVVGGHLFPNVFCIWTALQYIVFFYIGIQIRIGHEKGRNLWSDTVPILVWLGIDILLYVGYSILQSKGTLGFVGIILGLILHIWGALMAFYLLQRFANGVAWEESLFVRKLSGLTMPIYLFHQQVIYFVIWWLNGKIDPYIHAALNFVFAMTGSILISLLLKQFRITRILIGEK